MSEELRMWVEVTFNVAYLIVIWGLVIVMLRRRHELEPETRKTADLVTWAFGSLALGDTGHVGFRVWAYAAGGLESSITIAGLELGLVCLGNPREVAHDLLVPDNGSGQNSGIYRAVPVCPSEPCPILS